MNHAEMQGVPGERLQDVDSRGRARPWEEKKMRNELLAAAYESIDKAKACRLRECGRCLTYRLYPDGTRKLDSMVSCRVRLCPICSWRRSLKIFGQTKEIVDTLNTRYGYRWVMLTLTLKNVDRSGLNGCLDYLFKAWNAFARSADFKRAVKGWYRSLEVVHDCQPIITRAMWHGDAERHIYARGKWYKAHGYHIGDANPQYDTYHPHFHVLLAVNRSYFKSAAYLSQARWAELWRQALGVDYNPHVDVRTVKGDTMDDIAKAVAEVSKYASKDADYVIPDDWDLTVETVRTLDLALCRRRLVAYGGLMRAVKRELGQDDAETGDLVHLDGDDERRDEDYRLVSYWWWPGYRQYREVL